MTEKITRRATLSTGAAIAASSCTPAPKITPHISASDINSEVFAHGVASGDPGPDRVIIWTRVSPDVAQGASQIRVVWEVAGDVGFDDMRAKGENIASPARDWTVKVDLTNLAPGETYYYRFRIGDIYSPIGRTRTLPSGSVDSARFAIVSCSNFPFGYFNVYDLISRQDDLNAVLHLGDYLYEYSTQGYGGSVGEALGRNHEPTHEIISLSDYRTRHAQYKSDPAAQAMHAAHPIIAIWDDHETANDSWKDGAENHDALSEGDWERRRLAALQAYYEWMPVREPNGRPENFFRAFSFGDLLTVTAIETRLMARSRQWQYSEVVPTLTTQEKIDEFLNETLWDPSREMLGATQEAFIEKSLRDSHAAGQPWRVIANQVIMAAVKTADLTPHVEEEDILELQAEWSEARNFIESSALGLPTNFDAWDGYPAARESFYDRVEAATDSDGMIVVTGDTHTWWANDLKRRNGDHMGVELGVHSVTSPSSYHKDFLGGKGAEYALLTNQENKDIRYLSGNDHGFIDLTVSREKAEAQFVAVDTVETREYNAFTKVKFKIGKRGGLAKFTGSSGLTLKERFLF